MGWSLRLEWHPKRLDSPNQRNGTATARGPNTRGTGCRAPVQFLSALSGYEEKNPTLGLSLYCFESGPPGDYAPSIVFAQSAVEVSMMPLIELRLRRHSTKLCRAFYAGCL